jgi:hypothetical protein
VDYDGRGFLWYSGNEDISMGKGGGTNLGTIPLREGSGPDSVLLMEVLVLHLCITQEGVCRILQTAQSCA